jgi:hypothetical protein
VARRVVYNGVEMDQGWPERIRAAQAKRFVSIAGRKYSRIRYGDEADDRGPTGSLATIAGC